MVLSFVYKEVGQSPTSGKQCVHCARVASTAVMAGMAEIGGRAEPD